MIFRHPFASDHRRFKLGADALATFDRFRQIDPKSFEASGLMIGRTFDDGNAVVDEITTPGPLDKRSRFACSLEDPSHQQRLDDAWEQSDGRSNYLGHWHTHPEPDPRPSDIDLADWRRRISVETYPSDILLFVIVGTERTRMWLGSRDEEIITLESLP